MLARIDEVRQLLKADQVFNAVEIPPLTAVEGYGVWAESYDQPGNALIDLEQPIIEDIVDGLRAGLAVDVACGTGRHMRHLADRGNRVIGIDSSPDMLKRAQAKIPGASFIRGDLCELAISGRGSGPPPGHPPTQPLSA